MAYSPVLYRSNPTRRYRALKHLKDAHFWVWWWFTVTLNLIFLGLTTWAFIFMLHLTLTTPQCELQGTCFLDHPIQYGVHQSPVSAAR